MQPHFNYLAILIGAIAAFIVGSLWYGPLFGKKWMKLNNFTNEDLAKGQPFWQIMLISLGLYLIASFGLSMYLGENPSISFGAFAGFATAFFWIGTSKFNNLLYERQSKKLWLLHFGYDIISYTVMGAVIAAIQ